MYSKKIGSAILLGLAALIWGVAFVAQSVGMDYVGPFTFNAVRSVLGCIVLIPTVMMLDRKAEKAPSFWGTKDKEARKLLLIAGVLCGIALAAGSALQQFGIKYTSVGKAGFITTLYIIFVPLLGIFARRRILPLVWMSVIIAAIGMYFLCIKDDFSISKGDFLVLLCAVVFSFQIMTVDHFVGKVDGVRLSCIQLLISAFINAILMFIYEAPNVSELLSAWLPIVYAGVLSSAVGFTLQIVAQKHIHPVIASLIMSLESVFAALAGWIILGQNLSPRELLGCGLVFAAIILSQLRRPGSVNPE